MVDSILTSIKSLIFGPSADVNTEFDPELIMHINSVLLSVNQLGIGPSTGLFIEDDTTTWDDLFTYQGITRNDLHALKTYIYFRVRLIFDPPQTGYLVDSIKNQIVELEWRLNIQAEGVTV